MATDLEVAADFIRNNFCPSCGGRLRGTRGHRWGSTQTVVEAHGECFSDQLCWVLFADGRLMMTTHEQLNSGGLDLPRDVFLA